MFDSDISLTRQVAYAHRAILVFLEILAVCILRVEGIVLLLQQNPEKFLTLAFASLHAR